MALVEVDANDQACTLDTEHSLSGEETTDGSYCLWLDMNAAVAGDVFIVRVKHKVRSGGTQRLARAYVLDGTTIAATAAEKLFVTDVYPAVNGIEFSIEQTDGTGRTIPWSLLRV